MYCWKISMHKPHLRLLSLLRSPCSKFIIIFISPPTYPLILPDCPRIKEHVSWCDSLYFHELSCVCKQVCSWQGLPRYLPIIFLLYVWLLLVFRKVTPMVVFLNTNQYNSDLYGYKHILQIYVAYINISTINSIFFNEFSINYLSFSNFIVIFFKTYFDFNLFQFDECAYVRTSINSSDLIKVWKIM